MTNNELKRRARTAYEIYKLSYDVTLSDVYASYSVYKERAYRECINMMFTLNGYNFRIITHNTNIFTCGFVYEFCGIKRFMYITPNYQVYIDITTGD